ncbi:MAG: LysM peptidoglycan-binding domain-containing protein [Cellvibrio sp.]|nr:LysM peptidoglycan-binding domain-containing protein [Cellvibrio sp.]
MKKLLMAVIATSLISVMAWAQDVVQTTGTVLKMGHPDEYIVKKGDTLWDISGTFLDKPWLWPEIWEINPQIENPHWIYPGDLIRLVYREGNPRLTLERTTKLTPGTESADRQAIDGTTRLSPQIRAESIEDAISTIPLEEIDPFLSRSRVVNPGDLESAAYILQGSQQHLIVGEGDTVYARGNFTDKLGGYGIYRKAEAFVDPKTRELLGVHAQGIGDVSAVKYEKDIATLSVTRSYEEIRPGDRLLPTENLVLNAFFEPSAPDVDIDGLIMAVEKGVSQIGKLDVVFLNRGERDGIQDGNVLAIYKTGEVVADRVKGGKVALPDERAGLLMVFRTFEKMSFALVLETDRPLAVGDKIRNP